MNYFNESFTQEKEIKSTYDKTKIGDNQGECMKNTGCMASPVYECPQERVCHRYICYDVPHIMPCNTKIINHHVYRHTFEPLYTCCEENVCENVYGPRCC